MAQLLSSRFSLIHLYSTLVKSACAWKPVHAILSFRSKLVSPFFLLGLSLVLFTLHGYAFFIITITFNCWLFQHAKKLGKTIVRNLYFLHYRSLEGT